jgi:hypothetical protein
VSFRPFRLFATRDLARADNIQRRNLTRAFSSSPKSSGLSTTCAYPEHPIDHKIELCCFCILFYGLFLFLWSVFTDLNYGLFLLWLFVSWIEKNTQTLIKAFSDVNTVFSHTQVSILLDDKY